MEHAEPVVRGRFQLSSFCESWKHCSQASNYLAKLVVDQLPEAYYLYSSVINELLELAFRDGGREGALDVAVSLSPDLVILEIRLPAATTMVDTWRAYQAAGETRETVRAAYLRCLEHDEEPNPALGLLQITSDYDVELVFEQQQPQDRLVAHMHRLHP